MGYSRGMFLPQLIGSRFRVQSLPASGGAEGDQG
jgi:hypothetical protein